MPELPEVETIVRQLRPQILFKKIDKVEILRTSQWKGTNPEQAVSQLTGNMFNQVSRRAKFIIFTLHDEFQLIIHLRMSGKLMWTDNWIPINQYSRTIFYFVDHSSLQFNDTRALGTLKLYRPNEVPKNIKTLGIEPLSPAFTIFIFKQLLDQSNLEIKDFLMDQKRIAGIGNIYANEILFRSSIHPQRKTKSLSINEIETLFQTIPQVLQAAITSMGTTIGNKHSDYRTIYNVNGEFQSFLQVYGRKGESCYVCGTPIQRIVQKGRSSFFCYSCQR